jgi:O-antigen/teichoic acid export membrane protein
MSLRCVLDRIGMPSMSFAGLSKPALASMILLCAATGMGLLANSLFARLLGVEGFGIYSYALAILGILSVPYTVGLNQIILRSFATYSAQAAWGFMRGLERWASLWMPASALALATIAGALVWLVEGPELSDAMITQWIAYAALPVIALMTLGASTLQGLNKIVKGQLPDQIIRPGVLLVASATCWFLYGSNSLEAWQGMIALFAAFALAGSASVWMMRRELPVAAKNTPPQKEIESWLTSLWPFLVIGVLQQLSTQIDILMLGWVNGMEQVGIYRPATILAGVISFGLAAVSMPLRPAVANLFAAGDQRQLQITVTAAARLTFLFALPVGILLAVFGYWALLLLFGEPYSQGSTALAILCLSRVIAAGLGPVAIILNMTGHESVTLRGLSIAAASNALLCVALIPVLGIVGAALANAAAELIWKVSLAIGVYRRVQVISTALRLGVAKSS